MSTGPAAPTPRMPSWIGGSSTLNRFERVAFVGLLLVGVGVSAVMAVLAPDEDTPGALFELVVTGLFALYLWSPPAATVSLGAAMVLSFSAGLPQPTLVAFAIAAVCVARIGTPALLLGYAVALVVATVAVAGIADAAASAVGFLVVAVVLGGIGLILRAAHARGDRLDEQLERADERGRAAVAQERRRFAGELHDGIAHDLTVIALHAQMLDDPDEAVRRTAQATIQATTRNALGDLRYVIEMADDGPRDAAGFSSDPATALRQASETLEAAGYPVQVHLGALSRAPRRIGVVCARVLRECVTNVLKHAGPGTVGLDVEERDGHLHLTVRSSLPANRRSDLPSAGTGVARMSGHVRELGGELRAGADSGCWVVVARMPIA